MISNSPIRNERTGSNRFSLPGCPNGLDMILLKPPTLATDIAGDTRQISPAVLRVIKLVELLMFVLGAVILMNAI